MPTPGRKGPSNGYPRRAIRVERPDDDGRFGLQLGPPVGDLADDLRDGLLRHRDDGGRGLALRYGPFRQRHFPGDPATVRPDYRGRLCDGEDGPADPAPVRSDARAEVGHLDGNLLDRWRAVSDLQPRARRR